MKKTFLLLLVLALFLSSCEKNRLGQDDYFIFGISHGECIGDCVTYYRVHNEMLYGDFMETSGQEYNFDNQHLSNSDYLLAKSLFDEMPEYLLDNPNQTFGCPDCVDQGKVYVELSIDGTKTHWNIDADVDQNPEEIRAFVTLLLETIDSLP